MTMLKWLHKCLCNCASVLCLLPVAACCQAEDTLTLFRMLCLLFQLLATVTHPRTHPHTHTSAHINMHMPQCIALWHCLCQYCCYVALFRVCTADRNAKTKQQRKKSQRKRQHLLQTFRRMRLPVYVRMCHFNGLNCSTHSNGHACKLAAGESVSKCCHSPNCSRETGDKAHGQKCCIFSG